MFFTCGPNEAMVVSGFCRSPPVMVAGGRVLVVPCLQQIQRISLNTLTLNVRSEKVYTRHGVPISVTGIAQVKIQGQNKEMLAAACQMFLGKSESEIAQIALETLEGHQRAIMAHMTVEEIYKDRQKFSEQVFNVASSDLVNMGISVVSYTLKDIHDDQDYLHSLGKGRTAQVQRDARVGEAEAKRDAGIREARARQEQVSAQLLSETAMAQAQRDFQVQQAQCDAAVSARKAQADLAYQLQVARTKQQIEEERAQVLVVERAQQAQLQEHEIGRRELELEATVRKPAEAERYRLERLAEAQRSQMMMQAEAEAEAMRVTGAARAAAVAARARAEAAQTAAKAEAFGQYQEAAVVDMVLQRLPQATVANSEATGSARVAVSSSRRAPSSRAIAAARWPAVAPAVATVVAAVPQASLRCMTSPVNLAQVASTKATASCHLRVMVATVAQASPAVALGTAGSGVAPGVTVVLPVVAPVVALVASAMARARRSPRRPPISPWPLVSPDVPNTALDVPSMALACPQCVPSAGRQHVPNTATMMSPVSPGLSPTWPC
ncbi:LOW QUALITY PROTEIN: flotillin-1 [Gavia stellata]|uniref:LOW QUALITY PROTEIN: flotillin-1 n=1 Tax=Gavia stellata TaxID=37040 RepID=UPI002899C461|nr:LOW QUALITY PROTEIN: flotillin-1 [Gavia stellata]